MYEEKKIFSLNSASCVVNSERRDRGILKNQVMSIPLFERVRHDSQLKAALCPKLQLLLFHLFRMFESISIPKRPGPDIGRKLKNNFKAIHWQQQNATGMNW